MYKVKSGNRLGKYEPNKPVEGYVILQNRICSLNLEMSEQRESG